MHPAASVIFFTSASGAGYGLLFLLGIAGAAGIAEPSRSFGVVGLAVALGLIIAGLLSSTAHLGHPERAWRAMSQWRSSWLSREGLAALATFAPAFLFAYGWVIEEQTRGIWGFFGMIAALGAVATVYCTGMIYASLSTIRAWDHPLVVPGYMALGLYTGALLMSVLMLGFGDGGSFAPWIAILAGVFAAAIKLTYWRSVDTGSSASTAGTATGLGDLGRVRLLEAPTTSESYVMREMGYRIARKHADKLRRIALALGFVIPVGLLLLATVIRGEGAALLALPAAVVGCLGVVVERWLFFAEAKHVVTLYHGAEAA